MKNAILLTILLGGPLLFSQTLDALLEKKGRSLFGTSQQEVMEILGINRLYKDNEDGTQLRYSRRLGTALTFGSDEIAEAVFQFDKRHGLRGMTISVYNKGDCGVWDGKRFNEVLKRQKQTISSLKHAPEPESSSRFLGREKVSQMLWRFRGYCVTLVWSDSQNTPEYITVRFTDEKEGAGLNNALKTDVRKEGLPRNIQRNAGGDRFIPVPMVAQGDKGYCVNASVARLLQYYNSSVDLHIAAQMLDSTVHGTSINDALDGLKKNAAKLKLKVNHVYSDKDFHDFDRFGKFLREYNRVAKREKAEPFTKQELREYASRPDLTHCLSLMDASLFRQIRSGRSPGQSSFLRTVKQEIDAGRPLLWTVVLLEGGGVTYHARIINGYNEQRQYIYYTDSWGAGYEKERMSLAEAWAITMEMITARPF